MNLYILYKCNLLKVINGYFSHVWWSHIIILFSPLNLNESLYLGLPQLTKSKNFFLFDFLSVFWPGGSAPTNEVLRDLSSWMVDARGNTGTHDLSWFRPWGRTSSKGLCEGTVLSCTGGACSRSYKRGDRGREAPKSLLERRMIEASANIGCSVVLSVAFYRVGLIARPP